MSHHFIKQPQTFSHSNSKILFCHFSTVKLGEILDFCMTHSLACCKALLCTQWTLFFERKTIFMLYVSVPNGFSEKIIFYYSELSLHPRAIQHIHAMPPFLWIPSLYSNEGSLNSHRVHVTFPSIYIRA
jgi:hypothetical protein